MAKILPIITHPDKSLRKKSTPVSLDLVGTPDFDKLCLDMIETMIEKDGVGLAAPQIGKSIRLISINTKEGAFCMINPVITKKSWTKEIAEEGCLSVPNVFGEVKRPRSVQCIFIDQGGKKNTIKADGMMARVIQHEIDHLDGILFIDTAKKLKKQNQF